MVSIFSHQKRQTQIPWGTLHITGCPKSKQAHRAGNNHDPYLSVRNVKGKTTSERLALKYKPTLHMYAREMNLYVQTIDVYTRRKFTEFIHNSPQMEMIQMGSI
jgi:hypothetical protein